VSRKYDYQHAIEQARSRSDLTDEDRKILDEIEASFKRVQPLIDASRRAEEETKRWTRRCSCPNFCYFHTSLSGVKP